MTDRRRITLERTYEGTLDDVWALWTTREGIEAWWGPDGFTVLVEALEVRPGGTLRYAMTATGAPQIDFMKRAGMPLTTHTVVRFAEVDQPRRLRFVTIADFVPGVAPYEATTVVDLSAQGSQVRLVLTLDAMHDEEWTKRATMGWESQLGRLASALRR